MGLFLGSWLGSAHSVVYLLANMTWTNHDLVGPLQEVLIICKLIVYLRDLIKVRV